MVRAVTGLVPAELLASEGEQCFALVARRIIEHRLEQASQGTANGGTGTDAKHPLQVVPVDRQLTSLERGAALVADAFPKLAGSVEGGCVDVRAGGVGLSERKEVIEAIESDPRHEPPHGRIGP